MFFRSEVKGYFNVLDTQWGCIRYFFAVSVLASGDVGQVCPFKKKQLRIPCWYSEFSCDEREKLPSGSFPMLSRSSVRSEKKSDWPFMNV